MAVKYAGKIATILAGFNLAGCADVKVNICCETGNCLRYTYVEKRHAGLVDDQFALSADEWAAKIEAHAEDCARENSFTVRNVRAADIGFRLPDGRYFSIEATDLETVDTFNRVLIFGKGDEGIKEVYLTPEESGSIKDASSFAQIIDAVPQYRRRPVKYDCLAILIALNEECNLWDL